MSRHVSLFLSLCLTASLTLLPNAVRAADIEGEWITEGYGARVQITPCRDGHRTFCGHVTWLWEEVDETGRPFRDAKNPNRSLRERPIIGLELLEGFVSKTPGRWEGGTIYDPDSGRTFKARMTLRSPNVLEVKGCVFRICDKQIWRRPAEDLSMLSRK